MGTRSLTRVFDEYDNAEILCLYRHYDGYPDGHGEELASFLKEIKIVNGIGLNETRKIANGMGCLAAQLVVHFKLGADRKALPGAFYIYAPGSKDVGEEYVYEVRATNFRCIGKYSGKVLYDGPVSEFSADKCKEVEE